VSLDPRSPVELGKAARWSTPSGSTSGAITIKNTQGILFGVRILASAVMPTLHWAMLFDAIATPANGTTPLYRIAMPIGAAEIFDDFPRGIEFQTGIQLTLSSSINTLTAAVPAVDTYFHAFFI
jgi:hypothetical protein